MVNFNQNEAEQALVTVDAVRTREDDLEALRSDLLALERIASLDPSTTISLEDMEALIRLP